MVPSTEAYLRRIGLDRAPEPGPRGLARLQRAHLLHVPFECIDVYRRRPLSLEVDRLFEKVVTRRRGGFCYELNHLFAALLHDLGYEVTLLSAGVVDEEGEVGPDFDHMTLRVECEGSWLVDVGFGRSFLEPLPLRVGEHEDPAGRFRLRREGAHWWLDRHDPTETRADEEGWVALLRFDLLARKVEDFAQMFHFHRTSPDSPFPRAFLATLATDDGRITVRGLDVVESTGERKRRWTLEDERARQHLLRERLGLVE